MDIVLAREISPREEGKGTAIVDVPDYEVENGGFVPNGAHYLLEVEVTRVEDGGGRVIWVGDDPKELAKLWRRTSPQKVEFRLARTAS